MAMQIRQVTQFTGDVAVPGQAPAVFSQNAQDQLGFMNGLADELVNTISDMNDSATEMEDNAQKAESAVNTAEAILSGNGYKGLWPDTGGSASKGDTYQTQVGGTPTGEYYTALQNTTVDPVGDNVNWKVNISVRNISNSNLISNSSFEVAGSVAIPPDATPRSYSAGDELFSGFFAPEDLVNVTYIDGKLNGEKTSGGTGQLYVDIYKTEKQKLSTSPHVASIASSDGVPVESGASFVDSGDYWRVTFDMNETFSIKFEQGNVATGHEMEDLDKDNFASVLNYGATFHKQGDPRQEGTQVLQRAVNTGKIVRIPRGVELRVDVTLLDLSECVGILGAGVIETYNVGSNLVPSDFFLKGITITTKDNFDTYLRLRGTDDQNSNPDTWSSRVVLKDCKLGNEFPDGQPEQYLCIDMGFMNNSTYTSNQVYRGSSWFRSVLGCAVTSNNIDADRAGLTNRDLDTGADCVKFTQGTYGVISGNILENAGRDGIDAFSSGKHTSITGNVIRNFYTEGIEIKSDDNQSAGTLAEFITICGNVITDGGYDGADDHAAIFIRNLRTSERIHDINITGNVISKIGNIAPSSGNYRGILASGVDNVVISSNTITDVTNPSAVNSGVLISDVNTYVVSQNVIDSDDRGVTGGSLGKGVIAFNTITTNQTTAETIDYGVFLSGNNDGLKLVGNVISANLRAFNNEGGSISNADISGNTFINISGNAVVFGDFNDSIYSKNIHETQGTVDIVFSNNNARSGLTVIDNKFKGGRYGFNLRNSTGSVVTGNTSDGTNLCIHEDSGDYNIVKNNIQKNSSVNWQVGQPNSIFADNITTP